MSEKELYFKYGEIKGKITAILAYCNTAGYADKDVIINMLSGIDEPAFVELPQIEETAELQANSEWW